MHFGSWDTCVGHALCCALGGVCTDCSGNPVVYDASRTSHNNLGGAVMATTLSSWAAAAGRLGTIDITRDESGHIMSPEWLSERVRHHYPEAPEHLMFTAPNSTAVRGDCSEAIVGTRDGLIIVVQESIVLW